MGVKEQHPWRGGNLCPLPGGWAAVRGCGHIGETVRGSRRINEFDALSIAVDSVLRNPRWRVMYLHATMVHPSHVKCNHDLSNSVLMGHER